MISIDILFEYIRIYQRYGVLVKSSLLVAFPGFDFGFFICFFFCFTVLECGLVFCFGVFSYEAKQRRFCFMGFSVGQNEFITCKKEHFKCSVLCVSLDEKFISK